MITDTFLKLVAAYSPNQALANDLWLEIFTKYSEPKRHYHNIAHLENMIADLASVQHLISDWPTTLFAVYYHDIVYKATSSTNEEDSAKIAQQRLSEFGYPTEKIQKCTNMILATKSHERATDSDTNFLIDADMAVLGKNPDIYQEYRGNVRKEYSIYPDFVYNSGRAKVLQHFLKSESIFKTDFFRDMYETQARANIAAEIADLS